MNQPTTRAALEEAGFEALQRLYAAAIEYHEDHGGIVARFLLGLYNGTRFPFDLTRLRLLSAELLQDCMTVLTMDAQLTRKEVHNYFDHGGRKFEALAADWDVLDVERLRLTGDGTPTPRAQRGILRHEEYVAATLVTCGEAPGYRDVSLTVDCEVIGDDRQAVGPVRLEMNLRPDDAVRVMEHVRQVHAFAWSRPSGPPLDVQPAEKKPTWLL